MYSLEIDVYNHLNDDYNGREFWGIFSTLEKARETAKMAINNWPYKNNYPIDVYFTISRIIIDKVKDDSDVIEQWRETIS